MSREKLLSERILDAIHVDEVGLETGRYGTCLLKTIYHPIFLREGRDTATPWGVEGRTQPLREGKPLTEDVFAEAVAEEDELFVAAMRGVLPMRNYLNLGVDGLAILVGYEAPVYRELETAVSCIDAVVQAIADVWVDPSLVYYRMGVEVNDALLASVTTELKYRGIQTALDDFGTEQSALTRLQMSGSPLVKLDSRMFARLAYVPIAVRLMASIVELLQREGRQVLITGIDTAERLRVAVDMGANLLEGSLLRPARQAGVLFDMTPVNLAALLSGSENVVRFVSTMRGYRDMPQPR